MNMNMKQRLTALLYRFGRFCRVRQWDHMAERLLRWAVSLMPGSPDLHFALSQQAMIVQDFDGVAVEDGDDEQGLIVERTIALRPYPALKLFRDAMYASLKDKLPPDVWDYNAVA